MVGSAPENTKKAKNAEMEHVKKVSSVLIFEWRDNLQSAHYYISFVKKFIHIYVGPGNMSTQ